MKVLYTKSRGRTTVSAVDNKELFKHCAEGASKVTLRRFNKTVQPLLFLHGVVCIESEEVS